MENTDRRTVLVIAVITSFITPFMGSSINIALPSIGMELQLNTVSMNWIATSYILAAAMFLVPFGRAADIYGRKRIFLIGMCVYGFTTLLCAFSRSYVMLFLFRVLQGIGASMIFGTSMAILTSAYPENERGKVLGLNVASTYIGLSTGPFLGGFLTQHFGWRSIFYSIVPLGLAVVVLVLWKLKMDWVEARNEKFDFAGSVIYASALAVIIYGFSILPEKRGGWFVAAGIVGIAGFVAWCLKIESPVLDVQIFKSNRVFVFSSVAALVNYSATFAVGFLLSLYLQYIKGLNPGSAGIILTFQPVVQAAFSPLAGRLSDRFEPGLIASAGMAFTFVGLMLLVFINGQTSLLFIAVCLIILGFGFALFSSPNTNAVISSVEKKFYGVASGMVGTMRLLGQMFSMGIAMLVFAILIGKVQITPENYPLFLKSERIIFSILAVLCFGGIFASLARGNTR